MTGRLGYVRPISAKPLAANMRMVPVNKAEPLTCRAFERVGVDRMALDGGCAVTSGERHRGVEEGSRDASAAGALVDREAGDPPGAGIVGQDAAQRPIRQDGG